MSISSVSAMERSVLRALGAKPEAFTSAVAERRGVACALALLASDTVATVISAIGALALIRFLQGDTWPFNAAVAGHGVEDAVGIFAATSLLVLAYFAGQSHYNRRVSLWAEVRDISYVSVVALLSTGCIAFLLQAQGRLMAVPMAAWVIFPIAATVMRKLVRTCLSFAGLWQRRSVLIADHQHARQAIAALSSEPALGYDIVAVVDPAEVAAMNTPGRWRSLLATEGAELLVLSYDARAALGRNAVESVVRERVPFAIIPQPEGLPVLGFERTHFFSHDTVMLSYRNNLARPLSRVTKIVFDCVSAGAGLIFLMPLLLIIAGMVKLDGGPVFFGHVRVGAGGRRFRCLKFRSMVQDSEAVLQRVLDTDPAAAAEWAETQKLNRDPRITTIGRFLRKTSLDELPQLFNVMRLEMSLVGPRPIVNAEIARYGEDIAFYYETRPGLTGLWQVSGRNGTTYDRRVELDTWYVKNWTLWHDIAIIAKTLPAVLKQRGAC